MPIIFNLRLPKLIRFHANNLFSLGKEMNEKNGSERKIEMEEKRVDTLVRLYNNRGEPNERVRVQMISTNTIKSLGQRLLSIGRSVINKSRFHGTSVTNYEIIIVYMLAHRHG